MGLRLEKTFYFSKIFYIFNLSLSVLLLIITLQNLSIPPDISFYNLLIWIKILGYASSGVIYYLIYFRKYRDFMRNTSVSLFSMLTIFLIIDLVIFTFICIIINHFI